MLSAAVKTQLARRVPERGAERQLRRVGDGRGRQRGRREHRAGPTSVRNRRTHVGARSRNARTARAGIGSRGPLRAQGPHPARVLERPGEDRRDLPDRCARRALGRARRLGHHRRRGPHRALRARFGLHQLRRREDLPRRGRGRGARPSGCVRRDRGRCARRSLRTAGRGAREAARRRARSHARRAPAALPHEDRGLQGAAGPARRRRAPHEHQQARLRHCAGDRPRPAWSDGGRLGHAGPMQTRSIGSLDASVVGLGCNNFGGRIDEAATRRGRRCRARRGHQPLRHRRHLRRDAERGVPRARARRASRPTR